MHPAVHGEEIWHDWQFMHPDYHQAGVEEAMRNDPYLVRKAGHRLSVDSELYKPDDWEEVFGKTLAGSGMPIPAAEQGQLLSHYLNGVFKAGGRNALASLPDIDPDIMAEGEKFNGNVTKYKQWIAKSRTAIKPEGTGEGGLVPGGSQGRSHSDNPGSMGQAAGIKRYVDVNSPEFRDWFGNSQVVDEHGKPLMVYHGTPSGELEGDFDPTRAKDLGIHFGNSDQANFVVSDPWPGQKPTIYPSYLKAENMPEIKDVFGSSPSRALAEFKRVNAIKPESLPELEKLSDKYDTNIDPRLGAEEYKRAWNEKEATANEFWHRVKTSIRPEIDGFQYKNVGEGPGKSYAVLKPEQVRSAISPARNTMRHVYRGATGLK
jgi:hypothetical protein